MADVKLSHPDKVLFPEDGITKADLAEYYGSVADRMLPHVRDRPLNLWRWNAGIGEERERVSRGDREQHRLREGLRPGRTYRIGHATSRSPTAWVPGPSWRPTMAR